MNAYRLVQSRHDYAKKFKSVVVGVDLAISGNVGADYFVITVWGVDGPKNDMYLMYVFRGKGVPYSRQRALLKTVNSKFSPDVIVIESNQYQAVWQKRLVILVCQSISTIPVRISMILSMGFHRYR
jgi:hypothetical protein